MDNDNDLTISSSFLQSIMLADDDKNDREAFERALVQIASDKKLTIVTDGDELLHLLHYYVPDLLFIDLNMPCKNGIQCIREIREDKRYAQVPIVVFSATSRPNNIQVAYGLGANLFFVKPQVYSDLVISLRQILDLDWSDPEGISSQHFENNSYQPFRAR
jgi:CheY-like chemotaxis protein